jgi:hypothetical protein
MSKATPAKSFKSTAPRPYGRQAKGKTTRSVSLDSNLALWAEQQAVAGKRSLSSWINALLRRRKDTAV